MCTEDIICFLELRTATIILGILAILWSIAEGGLGAYAILTGYPQLESIGGMLYGVVDFVFALILFFGACLADSCMVKTYYIYGIIVCLGASILAMVLFAYNRLIAGLLFIAGIFLYIIILHFVVRRAYQTMKIHPRF